MPQVITVQILNEGADPESLELDLDLENLSMREAVRLEDALGPDVLADLMNGGMAKAAQRPSTIRALIYTKLKTVRPDVELDGFDLDLGELAESIAEEPDPKGSGPA